jgi:hypothetical protein
MDGYLVRRKSGWWILDYRNDPSMGPYATKAEAKDDLIGLRRSEPFVSEILELSGAALRRALRKNGLD